MKLFGYGKPRFEDAAKDIEERWQERVQITPQMRQSVSFLKNPEAARHFFEYFNEKCEDEMKFITSEMRKTNDFRLFQFGLGEFGAMLETQWLLVLLEGINDRINEQRENITKIALALRGENEAVETLAKTLSETPALTSEQAEALDLFKKAMDEMARADKRGQAPYV